MIFNFLKENGRMGLNSRVTGLKSDINEYMKLFMLKTIREKKKVRNSEFDTIFSENSKKKKEE